MKKGARKRRFLLSIGLIAVFVCFMALAYYIGNFPNELPAMNAENVMISAEESISLNSYSRGVSIDTDSKNQPHIVTEYNSIGGKGVNAYHKINGEWIKQEPLFADGTSRDETNGAYEGAKIRIDSKDRMWILTQIIGMFPDQNICPSTAKRSCGCCNGVSLFNSVLSTGTPTKLWGPVNVPTGIGAFDLDSYYPDNAFIFGPWVERQSFIAKFDDKGIAKMESANTLAKGGGETFDFAISSRQGQLGVMHSAGAGSMGAGLNSMYKNSLMNSQVEWADTSASNSGVGDYAHASVGTDLTNPEVAYLAGTTLKGLVINIWDGSKMIFPINNVYIADTSPAVLTFNGQAAGGNGAARFPAQWAPVKNGGAFLCWTSGDYKIKLKYISIKGVNDFGETITIGPGSKCSMATDSNGDIHLVYNNNGMKYRKITTNFAKCNAGEIRNESSCIVEKMVDAKGQLAEAVGLCKVGKKQDVCGESGKFAWTACSGPVQGSIAESCNGIDDDCDGETDENCDKDKDGYLTNLMSCGGDYSKIGSYAELKKIYDSYTENSAKELIILEEITGGETEQKPTFSGEMKVFENNTRFLADAEGKPIFLVGDYDDMSLVHHGQSYWRSFLDTAGLKSNYLRVNVNGMDFPDFVNPYPRVAGSGKTTKGNEGKFDVTKFNEEFFTDLKAFIELANEKKMFVHLSLFNEVFVKKNSNSCCGFKAHPFGNGNNINSGLIGNVDKNGDGSGMGSDEFYDVDALNGRTTDAKRLKVAELQRLFVNKILEETKDYPNVFYEVGNEVTNEAWTAYWVNYLKDKTNKPVTINCNCLANGKQDGATTHRIYFDGSSIAPNLALNAFSRSILVGADSDGDSSLRINPTSKTDFRTDVDKTRKASWFALVSGYNLMGYYNEGQDAATHMAIANYLGYLIGFIDDTGIDLGKMSVHNELVNSGKCLAEPGKQYLIYMLGGGVSINLASATGKFNVQVYNPKTGAWFESFAQTVIEGGKSTTLNSPFGEAVFWITSENFVGRNSAEEEIDNGDSDSVVPANLDNSIALLRIKCANCSELVNIEGNNGCLNLDIDDTSPATGSESGCIFDDDCNDKNVCTDDKCTAGKCVSNDNSAVCDDNNACTEEDKCSNGLCAGKIKNCSDGSDCTIDSCFKGKCIHTEINCGCSDNSDCDDDNRCTDDTCDQFTRTCTKEFNTLSCNDYDNSTTNDTCNYGECKGTLIQTGNTNTNTNPAGDSLLNLTNDNEAVETEDEIIIPDGSTISSEPAGKIHWWTKMFCKIGHPFNREKYELCISKRV